VSGEPRGGDWLVFLKNAAVSRPALNSNAPHIGEFALTRDFSSLAGELYLPKEEGDKCLDAAG
jgi:hypothetical protein